MSLSTTQSKYRNTRWIGHFESAICAVFTILVLFASGITLATIAVNSVTHRAINHALPIAISFTAALLWLLLDLPTLYRVATLSTRHEHPIALKIATTQRMLPLTVRPIAAIWWLAHFCIAGWLASTLHTSTQISWPDRFALLLYAIGLSVSGNAFLMLTICTLTSSPQIRFTTCKFVSCSTWPLLFLAPFFSTADLAHNPIPPLISCQ